jgi:hypothetical protein
MSFRTAITKPETVAIAGGVSGAVAGIAGAPRLGGSLMIASGLYNLYEGKRLVGGALGAVGLGMLFLPEIQKALSSKSATDATMTPPPPKLNEGNNPPVYYAGYFNDDIGGGWVVLDAREYREKPIDTDKDAHVGMQAALILQNKNAPPKVFKVKILGITGDDFTGQWIGGVPAGGPQMIDFRGANIYVLFPG